MRKTVLALLALACLSFGNFSVALAVESSSWDQTIQLSVPLRERIISFVVDDAARGDGSGSNPYLTYTSKVSVEITVDGIGEVVVTDNYGHVIYTYNKVNTGAETLTFPADLQDGVGSYELTARLIDPNNPNVVYDSKKIFVTYLPTTIPIVNPTTPDTPSTGVFYLGDRAFMIRDAVIVSFSFIAVVIFAVVVIIRRKNKNSPNLGAQTKSW